MSLVKDVVSCLTVAGSDSGGEAGVQADLQVFNHYACHGLNAVTAVTAQNPKEIISTNPVTAMGVADQLKSMSYFSVSAIKTGMLVSKANVQAVVNYLPVGVPLVVDPVMISTSGLSLLDEDARFTLVNELIPQSCVVTPNIPEACFLLGEEIECTEALARALFDKFKVGFYLKGGHSEFGVSVDFLICKEGFWSLETEVLDAPAVHGTGCRMSAALCANLAQGKSLFDSAVGSKRYMQKALMSWRSLGGGRYVMGPVDSGLPDPVVKVTSLN